MPKILDPKIEVENIHIQADPKSETNVKAAMEEMGYSKPIVKINAFVLDMGAINSLTINVNMFDIPRFHMSVEDKNYQIQSSLNNKEDRCVIFIGTQDFYIKFNGIITSLTTSKRSIISINGIFYTKELFDYKQEGFVDTSIVDILTKLCEDTKLGLYTYDNTKLQITPEYHLNPNLQQLSFISDTISTYTDNLWCIDTFGFLHIGSITEILKKPVDKYTLNPKTHELLESPQDIFFTYGRNRLTESEEKEEEKYKYAIEIENLKINSDYSLTKLDSTVGSVLYSEKGFDKILEANPSIGIEAISTENTFSGFSDNKYPLRQNIINKLLSGNVIKAELKNLMYEIVPFTLVNLEIFLPLSYTVNTKEIKQNEDGSEEVDLESEPKPEKAGYRLDEIHSGKHFVAGYSYHYNKNRSTDAPNAISQSLILI